MNLLQIKNHINQGQNLLFYNKDVHEIYTQLKDEHTCAFFNDPSPIKARIMECIERVVNQKEPALNRLTVPELIKILLVKLNSQIIVILFNNFHTLTRRLLGVYQELNRYRNIIFICGLEKDFKKEAYGFYKTFKLVNLEQYKMETGKDEINVSYTIYFFLGLMGFIIYLKTATSANMAAMLLGGAWFGLIIFRTFVYTGGRI